jgi:hypothetical protein
MELSPDQVDFDGNLIIDRHDPDHFMELSDLVNALQAGFGRIIEVTESNTSPVSPPPFMCGACEIEVDLETGKIRPLYYAAVVDCGTVINTNLARVQTEGGIVQGIGMALYEDIRYYGGLECFIPILKIIKYFISRFKEDENKINKLNEIIIDIFKYIIKFICFSKNNFENFKKILVPILAAIAEINQVNPNNYKNKLYFK